MERISVSIERRDHSRTVVVRTVWQPFGSTESWSASARVRLDAGKPTLDEVAAADVQRAVEIALDSLRAQLPF